VYLALAAAASRKLQGRRWTGLAGVAVWASNTLASGGLIRRERVVLLADLQGTLARVGDYGKILL